MKLLEFVRKYIKDRGEVKLYPFQDRMLDRIRKSRDGERTVIARRKTGVLYLHRLMKEVMSK